MVIDLGRQVAISAEGVAIPLSFAVPDAPGLWRADFNLLADPALSTELKLPSVLFSTYTWSVLGDETAKPIRIGTYNIYGFYGYPDDKARAALGYTNDPRRVAYYTDVIKKLSCDILGLQEGASVEQMVRYANAVGMHVAAFPSATAYPGGVFSSYPILETRTYNDTSSKGKTAPFSRTGSATLLDVQGKLLWVVNIHAHVNDVMLRQLEAEILDRELPNLAKVTPNIVVTGDFNSLPGADIHEALRKHGLYNAMQILSLIQPNQSEHVIDNIYVSESLVGYLKSGSMLNNPGSVAGTTDESTWRDSDHRPLVVELQWP
jgi:endonuclease/exonuclease/phosphatase family metal-dependent hydrolase